VDRVLGSLGLRADDAQGRRGYEAYLEGRAVECRADKPRETLEVDWKRIRRGWYLGEASFKERLLEQMGNLLEQRKTASVSGEGVRARSEQEAERWVGKALAVLKLDAAQLEALPKGAEAKLAMAWWLRCQTTMSRRWIAERLGMGHETRVTLAVRAVSATKRGRLGRLRERIARMGHEQT
jgi:hypothetical protein